jgi:amino acid transporter
MARDNALPFARSLSHVPERTRAPILPPLVIGALAVVFLIVNINLPHVIESLCSIAIVWANLAYLMVTLPMLFARLRQPRRTPADGRGMPGTPVRGHRQSDPEFFSMGALGLPVNAAAVAWGVLLILNIGWPRPEIYGADTPGRYAAPLATLALLAVGAVYYNLVQRHRSGILPEHSAPLAAGYRWPAVSSPFAVSTTR